MADTAALHGLKARLTRIAGMPVTELRTLYKTTTDAHLQHWIKVRLWEGPLFREIVESAGLYMAKGGGSEITDRTARLLSDGTWRTYQAAAIELGCTVPHLKSTLYRMEGKGTHSQSGRPRTPWRGYTIERRPTGKPDTCGRLAVEIECRIVVAPDAQRPKNGGRRLGTSHGLPDRTIDYSGVGA